MGSDGLTPFDIEVVAALTFVAFQRGRADMLVESFADGAVVLQIPQEHAEGVHLCLERLLRRV